MSKMPPSTTLDDNGDISDDESVDLLAPTQDGFALNSRDAPMSPDCLAVTQDVIPTTPVTAMDLNSSMHPLSARVCSLGGRLSDSGSQNNVRFSLAGMEVG